MGKLLKIRFFFWSEWRMPNARNKIKIHLKNRWINWCSTKSLLIRGRSFVKQVLLLIISNCLLRYRCKLHIENTRINIAQIVSQDKAIFYSWIVHIAHFPLKQFLRELENLSHCTKVASNDVKLLQSKFHFNVRFKCTSVRYQNTN